MTIGRSHARRRDPWLMSASHSLQPSCRPGQATVTVAIREAEVRDCVQRPARPKDKDRVSDKVGDLYRGDGIEEDGLEPVYSDAS